MKQTITKRCHEALLAGHQRQPRIVGLEISFAYGIWELEFGFFGLTCGIKEMGNCIKKS